MKNNNNLSAVSPAKLEEAPSKIMVLIFILEISLIAALLVLWLSSESIRQSKNLWVLFFYSLLSNFLIALVPHEPVILYFGKFYFPLKVAFITVAGTLIAEMINYSVFKFVTNLKLFYKMRYNKFTRKTVKLFNKAPFIALIVAGLTPVPFYPFRFLVVLAHYPLHKYILAVFLSRTPRYYLLALLGYSSKIPDYLLIVLFIILILIANISLLRNVIKKRRGTEKNVL